jgi:hypothetical protein
MEEINIWNVTSPTPKRFQKGFLNLEKNLENWIESDPSLVQHGLLIVGRQMHVEAGFLDLLGIDPFGRWVIIEIKKGNVRRQTVLQAIDYAACISDIAEGELRAKIDLYLKSFNTDMENLLEGQGLDSQMVFQNRDIVIFVVGTGRDQDLERMTKDLSFKGNPINVVNFDVFENSSDERVLVRKLTQLDGKKSDSNLKTSNIRSGGQPHNSEVDRLINLATQNGIGEEFRLIHEAATKHGLYPRTYKWSIMYTPPQNKTRCLLCAWAVPKKKSLIVYVASLAFAEFYQMSEREVTGLIGHDRHASIHGSQANTFTKDIDKLFQKISDSDND